MIRPPSRSSFLLTVALGLLPALPGSARAQSERPPLAVAVDPRVELVTLMARLAGFEEFNLPNSRSPYSERVEAHFGEHRSHPAIASLRRLRAQRGVSYDALPSLAVHLVGVARLELCAALDPRPERLDQRWGGLELLAFLEELRDFARTSRAADFFAGERDFYAEVERRLAERLGESQALEWFDRFFGARPQASYLAIPGLLCGGGNYGVGVHLGAGVPEAITPVFGCARFDADGIPTFDRSYLPLFIHELCHSYTNPFVDRHAERLRAPGERLFANCAQKMRRQGYGSGKTVLYESLVRACVVRCRTVLEGPKAGHQQARSEVGKHFTWVPELAELLGEYEAAREHHPDFESFFPRVIEFFERLADGMPDAGSLAPRLLRSVPASGAEEVDPGLELLLFEFDRPMLAGSWSFVGSPEEQPEHRAAPSYDAAGLVLSVPVRLQPGRSYRFWLNSERYQGFESAEGIPLAPVEIRFATAGD